MTGERASSIANYRECPRAYLLRKETDGLSTSPLERGTLVHAAIEVYLKRLGEGFTDDDAQAAALRYFYETSAASRAVIDEGEPFLLAFFDTPLPETEGQKWIEWHFKFNKDWEFTDNADDVHFHGRVDYAYLDEDGYLHVRDWKTAWKIRPESEIRDGLQLRVYAFALLKECRRRGITVEGVLLERHYVLQRILQSVAFDVDDFADLHEELDAIIWVMHNDKDFAPKPSTDRCSNCLVRLLCPAYKAAGMADMEPKDSNSAAALAREYGLLKAKVEDYKTMLSSWVDEHGPILLGDGESLAYQTVSKRKPKGDARQMLNFFGFTDGEILDVSSLGVAGVEKLVRKHPKRAEIVEAVFEEKAESHLKVVKDKEE